MGVTCRSLTMTSGIASKIKLGQVSSAQGLSPTNISSCSEQKFAAVQMQNSGFAAAQTVQFSERKGCGIIGHHMDGGGVPGLRAPAR